MISGGERGSDARHYGRREGDGEKKKLRKISEGRTEKKIKTKKGYQTAKWASEKGSPGTQIDSDEEGGKGKNRRKRKPTQWTQRGINLRQDQEKKKHNEKEEDRETEISKKTEESVGVHGQRRGRKKFRIRRPIGTKKKSNPRDEVLSLVGVERTLIKITKPDAG